jgi:hypothetical protein
VTAATLLVHAATNQLSLIAKHKVASANVIAQRTAHATSELLTTQDTLNSVTSEIRSYAMDVEDAEDVARLLYTDCTASFANISRMLDSTLMAQRRRAANSVHANAGAVHGSHG